MKVYVLSDKYDYGFRSVYATRELAEKARTESNQRDARHYEEYVKDSIKDGLTVDLDLKHFQSDLVIDEAEVIES
jgi:beta-glucosidase/6-phospho-beta-glucosidase/beta-galactosidase